MHGCMEVSIELMMVANHSPEQGQNPSISVQLVTHANSDQCCRLNSSQVSTCGFRSTLFSSRLFIVLRSLTAEYICAKNSEIKESRIINFAFFGSQALPLYLPPPMRMLTTSTAVLDQWRMHLFFFCSCTMQQL